MMTPRTTRTNRPAVILPAIGTICSLLLLGSCGKNPPKTSGDKTEPKKEQEVETEILRSQAPDGGGEIIWTSPTLDKTASK